MSATIQRIPYLGTVRENFSFLREAQYLATQSNVETAFVNVGRVNAPALLFDLFYSRTMAKEVLTAVIGNVWSNAEYPEKKIAREIWIEMFTAAGYTVDGQAAPKPVGELTLYRGSTDAAKDNMSWTDDLRIAETFAFGKIHGRPLGKIWTATVAPSRLLALNNGRDESEFVIDTTDLTIAAVSV